MDGPEDDLDRTAISARRRAGADDVGDTVLSERRAQTEPDEPDDRTVLSSRRAQTEPDDLDRTVLSVPKVPTELDDDTPGLPTSGGRQADGGAGDETLRAPRRPPADRAGRPAVADDMPVWQAPVAPSGSASSGSASSGSAHSGSAHSGSAHSGSAPSGSAPSSRVAGDGHAERTIYRPRPAEPARVTRAPEPPRAAPQSVVDTAAAQRRAARGRRWRLVVVAAVVLAVAVAAATVLALLLGGAPTP